MSWPGTDSKLTVCCKFADCVLTNCHHCIYLLTPVGASAPAGYTKALARTSFTGGSYGGGESERPSSSGWLRYL